MLKLITLPAQIAAAKVTNTAKAATNHVKTSVDNAKEAVGHVKVSIKARESKLEEQLAQLTAK